MYLIKRYANGRLYDTVGKKFITRDRIAGLVEEGENVAIVDTKTGDDITHRILDRIDVAAGKGRNTDAAAGEAPHESVESVFAEFFKKGEEVFSECKKRYDAMRQNISDLPKDDIDKLLEAVKRKKQAGEKDAGRFIDEVDQYRKSFQDWVSGTIDRRVDEALEKMNMAGQKEFRELSRSIDALRQKVETLEKEIAGKKDAD